MTNHYKWRVATRKRGREDWDVSPTRMTADNARSAAKQLNIVYPGYEHKAIKVEK